MLKTLDTSEFVLHSVDTLPTNSVVTILQYEVTPVWISNPIVTHPSYDGTLETSLALAYAYYNHVPCATSILDKSKPLILSSSDTTSHKEITVFPEGWSTMLMSPPYNSFLEFVKNIVHMCTLRPSILSSFVLEQFLPESGMALLKLLISKAFPSHSWGKEDFWYRPTYAEVPLFFVDQDLLTSFIHSDKYLSAEVHYDDMVLRTRLINENVVEPNGYVAPWMSAVHRLQDYPKQVLIIEQNFPGFCDYLRGVFSKDDDPYRIHFNDVYKVIAEYSSLLFAMWPEVVQCIVPEMKFDRNSTQFFYEPIVCLTSQQEEQLLLEVGTYENPIESDFVCAKCLSNYGSGHCFVDDLLIMQEERGPPHDRSFIARGVSLAAGLSVTVSSYRKVRAKQVLITAICHPSCKFAKGGDYTYKLSNNYLLGVIDNLGFPRFTSFPLIRDAVIKFLDPSFSTFHMAIPPDKLCLAYQPKVLTSENVDPCFFEPDASMIYFHRVSDDTEDYWISFFTTPVFYIIYKMWQLEFQSSKRIFPKSEVHLDLMGIYAHEGTKALECLYSVCHRKTFNDPVQLLESHLHRWYEPERYPLYFSQ